MYEDNRAARLLASEGAGSRKARHIDVRYHYVQELVERGVVVVRECSSKEQLADALTKSVATDIQRKCARSYFNM
jgi:hypothetical protein